MDLIALVALKVFLISFMVGGYLLARRIRAQRMAPVIVTQELPAGGQSTPAIVHIVDAQQYNDLGFVQLSRTQINHGPPPTPGWEKDPAKY
uniref:Uncharacterized protein n=1 Tax=Anopheles dirus TaxID=7168 RepID=A0A182NXP5_9DIPT